jgi:hypothetical protein
MKLAQLPSSVLQELSFGYLVRAAGVVILAPEPADVLL